MAFKSLPLRADTELNISVGISNLTSVAWNCDLPFLFSVRELTVGSIFQCHFSSHNVNVLRWLLNEHGLHFVSRWTGPVLHTHYGCKYICQIFCQFMYLTVTRYWKGGIHSCWSCLVETALQNWAMQRLVDLLSRLGCQGIYFGGEVTG